MQSTSSSDARYEPDNRLVGDDHPGPDHRRVRDRTAVRPRHAPAIPARALRHNAACCVPASRGFGHCPRHWAVSAQRAPAEPFSPRPSLDGPHLRDRRLVRWSSGAGTRDDFASGTADPRRVWVACGALAIRHRKRVPAHQGGRSSVASPLDDSQLRADIRRRDAPDLSTAQPKRRHAVRCRLSDDCLALLGPESHRCRVDHPAATDRCFDRRTKLRRLYGRCIGEFWLQEQAGCTGQRAPKAECAAGRRARCADRQRCRGAAIEQAPNVHWVADRSLSADLTYDGAAERVYWGTGGDTAFVVAIVECAEGKPGRVWAFPLRGRAMFGTTDLEIFLVNPAFGQGCFT